MSPLPKEGQPPPDLRIVPRTSIILQEDPDEQRSRLVAEGTETRGKFQDPIIVTPFGEKDFLQLDGANRTRASDLLGLDWVVAQVFDPYSLITLTSWVHQTRISPDRLQQLGEHGDLALTEGKRVNDGLVPIALLHLFREEKHLVSVGMDGENDPIRKARAMKRVVDLYEHDPTRLPFHQPTDDDFWMAMGAKSNLDTFVQFPAFRHDEVLSIASSGERIPSGITRHLIGVTPDGTIDPNAPFRDLHVDFPLKYLRGGTQEQRQQQLSEWLTQGSVNDYEGKTRVYSWPW